ncbi:hypothetical protein [Motilibacter deserti]|uniref:Uncharacterized protein n=1 Tax=Motilibacter deserti TaxID=2714956 RepID=A0ABX0GTR2_9ACTN|nr:hypothetical protein [Motilibacter deserti]NHC14299.1 hypothetical protein [Motilibacter deserti]
MDQTSSINAAGSGAAEVLELRRALSALQTKATQLLAALPSDAEATAPTKPGLYL